LCAALSGLPRDETRPRDVAAGQRGLPTANALRDCRFGFRIETCNRLLQPFRE